jgi:phosphoglycolate phosphatase
MIQKAAQRNSMKYNTVFFDLDGTLTDPYEGIVNGHKYALEKFGIIETDEKRLRTFIGPPLELVYSEDYGFNPEDTAKAVTFYRTYYGEKGVYENKLYDGIVDLLELLKAKKIRCMVATSKAEPFALQVLNNFNLLHYFDDVSAALMDGSRSDKADIISHLIEKHHLEKSSIVMVGDRKYDIIGAQKTGIDSIGVGYGHGEESELKETGATYFCKDMKSLINFFS